MKKSFCFSVLVVFAALVMAPKVWAGITYVKFRATADSSVTHCTVPSSVVFVLERSGFVGISGASSDSVLMHIDYGDGSTMDTTFYHDGLSGSSSVGMFVRVLKVAHAYTTAGIYRPKFVYETKYGGYKDSCLSPSIGISASCARLSGRVYFDDNTNCVWDLSDRGIMWAKMRMINTATSDTFYSTRFTDSSGQYGMNIVPGTYVASSVVYLASPYWPHSYGDSIISTCGGTGSSTVTVLPSTTYTSNFGYVCAPSSSYDAYVNVSANCYVPGDTTLMTIWAGDWWSFYHNSCIGRSTTITLLLDPLLSYASSYSGTAPTSIVGKLLTWNLSSTDISNFRSQIKVAVASSATLGSTLCSEAYIAPATGYPDPDTSNNHQNYCLKVSSAYDPNTKEAAPNGTGKEGYIAANTPMTYTIHFQNTGTAAARNINIIDTLDSSLEASSLHLLHSSHNALLSLSGNVAEFQFENIYLPDSSTDYYGSMGYVTFAILPKPDLSPATKIQNRAAIYFDFNEPISTNTALNTIIMPTKIAHITQGNMKASIYPNPAHAALHISTEKRTACSVQLIDLLGKTIAQERSETGTLTISTINIASGIYLLRITDNNGQQLNSKIQISH